MVKYSRIAWMAFEYNIFFQFCFFFSFFFVCTKHTIFFLLLNGTNIFKPWSLTNNWFGSLSVGAAVALKKLWIYVLNECFIYFFFIIFLPLHSKYSNACNHNKWLELLYELTDAHFEIRTSFFFISVFIVNNKCGISTE